MFNRTNPNFDSWLQIFSCLSLLSNISLDALIVPWMHRFTSHNLHKLFTLTAIFTSVYRSMVLSSPHTCVYSECPPPRESKRFSIMPFQTLSTEQSEVAEFAITRLGYHILFRLYLLKEIFVQVTFFYIC